MRHRRTGEAGKKTKLINGVEHIIISYNEEDQSYGVEGEVCRFRGVPVLFSLVVKIIPPSPSRLLI